MNPTRWLAIAALDPDRVIGSDGTLPWHLPGDLRLFKQLTMGKPILMGRNTWESLPRRPLPGRRNLVLSRTLDPAAAPEAGIFPDFADVEQAVATEPEVCVIGGATLYNLLLPRFDELILTHVASRYSGDTFFPQYESAFAAVETLAETPEFRTVRYLRNA